MSGSLRRLTYVVIGRMPELEATEPEHCHPGRLVGAEYEGFKRDNIKSLSTR